MNLNELMQMYDFSGQTAVVTGGTGLLGGHMAAALAGCGANVAILARKPDLTDDLKRALDGGPGRYLVTAADVLDGNALIEAQRAVEAAFGPADILINAAGGNLPGAITSAQLSFFDLPREALDGVFDLNMAGTVLPCQVFGRAMAERGRGTILNVSSMNAYRPLTRNVAYSAAKAAVTNFTQWLAVYMAREYNPGIRVNAIAPGFFLTNQNRSLLTDEASGELTSRGRAILEHTPMGRSGSPRTWPGRPCGCSRRPPHS